MNNYISSNVICFDHFKTAAIHFDRVIPISYEVLAQSIVPFGTSDKSLKSYGSIQKTLELTQDAYRNVWDIIYRKAQESAYDAHITWEDAVEKFARATLADSKQGKQKEYDLTRLIKSLQGQTESTKTLYKRFLHTFDVTQAALFVPDGTRLLQDASNPDEIAQDVMVTIAGIPLVDAERATLAQVRQLRDDKEAQRKLRNLRIFLFENYNGKPSSFVEDDIHKKIDDYQVAASKHGFDILESCLACLIDAKSIQSAIAGGFVGWLFGGPVLGITSGVTTEIASLTLTLMKGIREFSVFRQQHDLAYIFHAKKSIGKRK